MEVLYLTIPLSVALAVLFVGGFLYHVFRASGDPLRDSLLPFRPDDSCRDDVTDESSISHHECRNHHV